MGENNDHYRPGLWVGRVDQWYCDRESMAEVRPKGSSHFDASKGTRIEDEKETRLY